MPAAMAMILDIAVQNMLDFLPAVRHQLDQSGDAHQRYAGAVGLSDLLHAGEMGRTLYDIGFRVFSMSNNHTYDRGAAGIAATRAYWAAMPDDVVTCGLYTNAEHHPADQPRSYDTEIAEYPEIAYQEVNGVRIAYLAYTEAHQRNSYPFQRRGHCDLHQPDRCDGAPDSSGPPTGRPGGGERHWGVEDSHLVTDAQRTLASSRWIEARM